MAHEKTACDQCGQVDDHPKVHVFDGGTWHHDCTPHSVKQQILTGVHGVAAEVTGAVFDACEGGLRGDDLREHITALHKES